MAHLFIISFKTTLTAITDEIVDGNDVVEDPTWKVNDKNKDFSI